MTIHAAAAILLLAQTAPELIKKIVDSTLAQKSFEASLKARLDIPDSDTLHIEVTALSVPAENLVFIEYHASGGNVKLIVRKGDTVLEYHPLLRKWLDARELGDDTAGRGLQDPTELLNMLRANADVAHDAGIENDRRILTLNLGGDRIKRLLKDYVEEGVRWGESKANLQLAVDSATHLPSKISSAAALAWKKDKEIEYRGELSVLSYGAKTEYRFFERDRNNKPLREIPLPPEARQKLGLPK